MAAKTPAKVRAVPRWVLLPVLLSFCVHMVAGGTLPHYLSTGYQFLESQITKRYQPVRIRVVKSVRMTGAQRAATQRTTVQENKIDMERMMEDLPSNVLALPTPDGPETTTAVTTEPTRKKWEHEHYRVVVRKGAPQVADANGLGSRYGALHVFEDRVVRVVYNPQGSTSGGGGQGLGATELVMGTLLAASFAPKLDLSPQTVTKTDAGGPVQKGEPEEGFKIELVPEVPSVSESVADDVRQAKIPEPPIPTRPDKPDEVTPPKLDFTEPQLDPIRIAKSLEPFVQTEFRVYREPGSDKSFFKLAIRAKEGAELPVIRKNVLFVVDISLSVDQDELDEVRKAARTYLTQLHPEDKLNVIRFSEEARGAFGDFVPPTPQNIEQALEFIKKVPGQIKTDVYRVLHSIILKIYSRYSPCHVFLVTDGKSTQGIRDTQRIVRDIAPVTRSNISIFTIDIGKGGNRYLLDLVAYRSRGELLKIDDLSTAETALVKFATRRDIPILMNLSVNYANLQADEVYPQILPNLYRGQEVEIFGRCEPGRKCAIQIYGQAAGGKWKRFLYPFSVSDISDGKPEIAREWARGKIHYLVARIAREGKEQETIDEILRLGEKYDLPIPIKKN